MKIITRDHSQILHNTPKIIVKFKMWQIILLFSIAIFSWNTNYVSAADTNSDEYCPTDKGLILDEEKQCIPKCGSGTTWNGKNCVAESEAMQALTDIDFWVGVGIVAGIILSWWAIRNAAKERKDQINKENLEIIQNYGNQISEIVKGEKELDTKLDCALYAEQYLDTLEQIATLHEKNILRDEVTDYFYPRFRYGINLWTWYKLNVEKIPDYELKKIEEIDPLDESKLDDSDRWYEFTRWCIRGELKPFNSQVMSKIIEDRLKILNEKIKNTNQNEKLKLQIRETFLKQLEGKLKENEEKGIHWLEEGDIRSIFDNNEDFAKLDILDFVRKYSKDAENKILPDLMENEYEDIPDENGLSKFEILESIQKFSDKIIEIKNLERKLHSKLDCIVYAEQYLDTMDQIASLYRKRLFPKDAVSYFENYFGYGINLMNWYYKFVLKGKIKEFDSDEKITQQELDDESEREDRWIDFRWICRGGDARRPENKIKRFIRKDEDMEESVIAVIGNEITLPMTMYQYEELPEEEGVNPEEVLEIMREYSTTLIEITETETKLKTQADCAVYAEQYLDILDQIAYLLNTKALATESSTFFENNFSYGLTLKIWYDLMVTGAEGQEGRWSEFIKYCDAFQDDKYNYKILTPFSLKDSLPTSMLFLDELVVDLTHENKPIKYPRKTDGTLNIPEIYYKWENYYKNWYDAQKEIEVKNKKDLKNRESIQDAIKRFSKLWRDLEEAKNELKKLKRKKETK